MKKVVLSVVAALAFSAAPAFAADLPVKAVKTPAPAPAAAPSPWDIAFGSAIMNDYVFRGVTQSNHRPSVAAYFEPRYNVTKDIQLYVGMSGESISFANNAAAEIDFYGGIRPTFGPFAFDFGFWYYDYPGGTCYFGNASCPNVLLNGNVAKANASFWEFYGKVTLYLDDWAFGANFYYSPNFLHTGADGRISFWTVKFTAPEKMAIGPFGWYVSGEFGRQWLGTSDSFYGIPAGTAIAGTHQVTTGVYAAGIPYTDYDTWNIGIGFTCKVFTLDLRYSGTDSQQGQLQCLHKRSRSFRHRQRDCDQSLRRSGRIGAAQPLSPSCRPT